MRKLCADSFSLLLCFFFFCLFVCLFCFVFCFCLFFCFLVYVFVFLSVSCCFACLFACLVTFVSFIFIFFILLSPHPLETFGKRFLSTFGPTARKLLPLSLRKQRISVFLTCTTFCLASVGSSASVAIVVHRVTHCFTVHKVEIQQVGLFFRDGSAKTINAGAATRR